MLAASTMLNISFWALAPASLPTLESMQQQAFCSPHSGHLLGKKPPSLPAPSNRPQVPKAKAPFLTSQKGSLHLIIVPAGRHGSLFDANGPWDAVLEEEDM
jgi:hypothetical protein